MRRTSSSTITIRSGVTSRMSGSSTKASWVLVPDVGIVGRPGCAGAGFGVAGAVLEPKPCRPRRCRSTPRRRARRARPARGPRTRRWSRSDVAAVERRQRRRQRHVPEVHPLGARAGVVTGAAAGGEQDGDQGDEGDPSNHARSDDGGSSAGSRGTPAVSGEDLGDGAFGGLDGAVEVAHPLGGGLGAGPVDRADGLAQRGTEAGPGAGGEVGAVAAPGPGLGGPVPLDVVEWVRPPSGRSTGPGSRRRPAAGRSGTSRPSTRAWLPS